MTLQPSDHNPLHWHGSCITSIKLCLQIFAVEGGDLFARHLCCGVHKRAFRSLVRRQATQVACSMQAFQTMAKRETIRRAVEKKTADFHRIYIDDLNIVKKQLDLLKRVPPSEPVLPRYAGQATLALVLAKRVDSTWQALQVCLKPVPLSQGSGPLPMVLSNTKRLGKLANQLLREPAQLRSCQLLTSDFDVCSAKQCTSRPLM